MWGNQEWLNHLDLYVMVDRAIEHHELNTQKLLVPNIEALLFDLNIKMIPAEPWYNSLNK